MKHFTLFIIVILLILCSSVFNVLSAYEPDFPPEIDVIEVLPDPNQRDGWVLIHVVVSDDRGVTGIKLFINGKEKVWGVYDELYYYLEFGDELEYTIIAVTEDRSGNEAAAMLQISP